MSPWYNDIQEIIDRINFLDKYRVSFLNAREFITFSENMNVRFQLYHDMMLMGHFDNAFTDIMEEKYPSYKDRCRVRIISHRFNKGDIDDANRRSLESLADLGAEIKVNVDAHARMFIGYNENSSSELILGSFDFNRDGLSRRKANAGIVTKNEDLIKDAITFFERTWDKKGSVPLKNYIK